MRGYLYIWNDPVNQFIVASGIEFRDLSPYVGGGGGLVLLDSGAWLYDYVYQDQKTLLYHVTSDSIPQLAKENIYHWGNFCWADYTGEAFPEVSDQEIAELFYFDHMSKPLGRIVMPSLNNKFLCWSHDDGWYLQLFYTSWDDIMPMICGLYPRLDVEELRGGSTAYWLSGSHVEIEERTFDVDAVMHRRIQITRKPRRGSPSGAWMRRRSKWRRK
jgi:hypothetical protein